MDYGAEADMIKARIKPTPVEAINARMRQVVADFQNEDNSEAAFKNLVNALPLDVCDEIIGGLEAHHRNVPARVKALSLMLPEYRTLCQQINEAEEARTQLESSMLYPRFVGSGPFEVKIGDL